MVVRATAMAAVDVDRRTARDGLTGLGFARFVVLIAATVCLTGCAAIQDVPQDDALATAARACLAQHKQFIDVWGCVQSQDVQAGDDTPRRKQLMKLGDDLASQVETKELSSDAARKRMTDGLSAVGSL